MKSWTLKHLEILSLIPDVVHARLIFWLWLSLIMKSLPAPRSRETSTSTNLSQGLHLGSFLCLDTQGLPPALELLLNLQAHVPRSPQEAGPSAQPHRASCAATPAPDMQLVVLTLAWHHHHSARVNKLRGRHNLGWEPYLRGCSAPQPSCCT